MSAGASASGKAAQTRKSFGKHRLNLYARPIATLQKIVGKASRFPNAPYVVGMERRCEKCCFVPLIIDIGKSKGERS
jgi:hypothetical protein